MVLKHNCDVGFVGFFSIFKYLQSCSVDICIETAYKRRKYSMML